MLHGLTSFQPSVLFTLYDYLEFLIRIVLSALFGIFIGLERMKRQKDAGVRTHCIIAVTSAAFMILSKYAFWDMSGILGDKAADPARIAAQVVSGISFIGAGVIFKDKNFSIRGLTTAAGIWATAAVGMAIGAGLYWLGVFEVAAVMLSQMLLHRFPIANDALMTQMFTVRILDRPEARALVDELIQAHLASIDQSDILRENDMLTVQYVLRLKEPITHEEAMKLLTECVDVHEVSV